MPALDYLLPQPPLDLTPTKQAEFETLIDSTPVGAFVDFRLTHPKWQFLSYQCQSRQLVLHGSQVLELTVVEPRKANDIKAFSALEAIYATTDGIWVIYFAIIDRKNFSPLSLFNSCVNVRISPDQVFGPLYFLTMSLTISINCELTAGLPSKSLVHLLCKALTRP